MVVAQKHVAVPQVTPRRAGGKGEPGAITLSTTVLSVSYDAVPPPQQILLRPLRLKGAGSSWPRSHSAPTARRTPRSWELPCPIQPGSAEQGMGRQGLNHPPQLPVAKGNIKCQSHQPQYVRAPAKRSSAQTTLVPAVPTPLPRPGGAGSIPHQPLGRVLPMGSAMRGRAWTRLQGQMGTRQEG